ncbi:hypothetical protein [Nocardia sp. NPDC052112]|uniref:hypothetical protein n=1 Tax=Nocardia sp. NPDC052112 TaxID=3155646 RepID=UPI00342CF6F3
MTFPDPDPDDAVGTGRVGALAAPSEPVPDDAPDPGDTLGPDAADAGRGAAVPEAAPPEAADPEEVPGLEAVPGCEGVPEPAGPGRVGALDPDELGTDDERNGRVASAAPSGAPAATGVPVPSAGPGRVGAFGPEVELGPDGAGMRRVAAASAPEAVPEPSAEPGREGAPDPGSAGLGDAGVRSAGAAERGSASAGRPGFRAGLFSSFGSDTYNPSLGRNS